MQARELETIYLSAAGQPGQPGTQEWADRNNHPAPKGKPGHHGQDACPPSAGTSGHDLRVRLSYADDRPAMVQVSGEGPLTGQRWEVARDQNVLLDCPGGDGGDGGRGENGQRGGQGRHGRDATQWQDATCGTPGLPGGNAGRGTSGADGGDAGSVYITVGEDDLDTLVAVEYNITGGKGGASGVHGEPGEGGPGGNGGNPCSWTERHSHTVTDSNGYSHTKYYTTHHTSPGAPPGPQGPPGTRPTDPLYGGQSGRDGVCQIRVLRKDLTEGTYPSRYQLIVKDFDVIDENMDGINEPGEYLLVQNIQIENIGRMPSPRANILKILIQPTPWLEPVVSEPLELPQEIQPGATVRVPGVLKALIKNESEARAPGTSFFAQDTVALVAFFERLQRPLPEFAGGVSVKYQYPLVMTIPRYLDSVAKGDTVRFSWMIKNNSTKAYGGESELLRQCGTNMSDPHGVFDLKYASKESPHEANDLIDILDSGAEVSATEDFQVSQSVPILTTGFIVISLLLADPHTGAFRQITSFNLSIQISSRYLYNPLSRFLLIINGSTPNASILQTIDFINNDLHLPVDVFNLSLTGSLRNPATEQNVLSNYLGKTVIMFANQMNYFQTGARDPWDLLDPWEATIFAKRGTNFLLINPTNIDGLKIWASQMALPSFGPFGPLVRKASGVLPLLKAGKEGPSHDANLTLLVKKGFLRSLDSNLQSQAKSMRKKLDKSLPLRRFIIAAEPDAQQPAAGPATGSMTIVEGLPNWANLSASLQPHADGLTSLTDYNIAMIVHSLPFQEQCAIFWNLLEYDHSLGIRTGRAYRGEGLTHLHGNQRATDDFEKTSILSSKAYEALSWSISTHLNSELSSLCVKSPWPSFLSASGLKSQLPLLNTFISTAPTSLNLSSDIGISSLAAVLGPIIGAQDPLGIGQWIGQYVFIGLGSRKSKIRSLLARETGNLTKTLCSSMNSRRRLLQAILTSSNSTKKTLSHIKSQQPSFNCVQRLHSLSCQALGVLTQTPGANFLDMNALIGVQRSMNLSKAGVGERRRAHAEWMARLQQDEGWSRQMLTEMVNPADEA